MGQNNIKKILEEINKARDPLKELEKRIDNANLAALIRRKFFEKELGISLSATGSSILDFVDLDGRISYRPVGAVQVPVTIIGPINIHGVEVKGSKYAPLSSIYPESMRAMDLGVTALRDSSIEIKLEKCWVRLFNIGRKRRCMEIEHLVKNKDKKLHVLCYGRESGGLVETILIGETLPCLTLRHMIKTSGISALVKLLGSPRIPVLAPYLTLDYRLSSFIPRSSISSLGVEQPDLMKTYNALENMKGIDNSLIPVTLGILSSFYLSIGVKPEYALRSEVKRYFLVGGFRGVRLGLDIRIALPYSLDLTDQSIMNRELYKVVSTDEKTNILLIGELASALALISYIGELVMVARSS